MDYGWIRLQPYLLILVMASVSPDSTAVYILNEHLQLVTSTSLRWVGAMHLVHIIVIIFLENV